MTAIAAELAQELFDGTTLKGAYKAALTLVEKHIDELNLMNVFPVPDGDTGINMFVTLRAANKAVADLPSTSASVVANAAARGALLGASGNSGVILSQILRGLAKGLAVQERFSSSHFAQALHEAAENAYRAVAHPVEGTILTVSKRASLTALRMADRGASLRQMMTAVVAEARRTVKRTPELLPQLKEAGVEDAGARGLLYVLQGMKEFISSHVSEAVASAPRPRVRRTPRTASATTEKRYGFDLQFLVSGRTLPVAQMRAHIDGMGESVLVVGDEQVVRVHIHTHNPDTVLDYARGFGEVTDVVSQDMDTQVEHFRKDQAPARVRSRRAAPRAVGSRLPRPAPPTTG